MRVPRSTRRLPQYDLVSFEHPPVAEVALSVQFQRDAVDLEALGRFAREVRPELPVRQRQLVAPRIVETFDTAPPTPTIQIQIEAPTTFPRIWFMSEDGVQLVQLQHDRFTLNWREGELDATYPRYEQLRTRFEELFGRLLAGLDEVGIEPCIDLCEVTYVNPIEPRDGGAGVGHHPDLATVINRLRPRPRDAFLPEAEDAQLFARWRIPREEVGQEGPMPAGRLYVSASPGLKPPKNTPIYLVNLIARVIPADADTDSAMAALDVGHKWAVLGFKDLTTSRMHREWGLKERTA